MEARSDDGMTRRARWLRNAVAVGAGGIALGTVGVGAPVGTDSAGASSALQTWQIQYFGSTANSASNPDADPDGDGLSNSQEFRAGTDPTNNSSALRMLGLSTEGNNVRISWQAGGGRTYVMQAARSFAGVFFNISPPIMISNVGDIVSTYLNNDVVKNTACRFYRIATWSASAGGTTAPKLAVLSPMNDAYIIDPEFAVKGTCANDTGVSGVDVQGYAASSSNGYSDWVAIVTGLAPGTNTLTVLAGDNAAPANITTNSLRVINATGDFDGNGDGLPDGWQIRYFGSVGAPSASPGADPDGDGVSNLQEHSDGTDPTDSTSKLRITDIVRAGDDMRVYFTSVNEKYYSLERFDAVSGTWIKIVDNVAGNGGIQWIKDIVDDQEQKPSYRVQVSQSNDPHTEDSDANNIEDSWTQRYFGHPTGMGQDSSRAGDDPDRDGLSNLQEFQLGTDPLNADTEGDGMSDSWEVANGLNPNDPADANTDLDGDGLTNIEEFRIGTSPKNVDSDSNGICDGPLVPSGVATKTRYRSLAPSNSGLDAGPDPDLVVVNGRAYSSFTANDTLTIGLLGLGRGPALCPLLRVSLNPTMSPSTVYDTSGGPITHILPKDFSQIFGNLYVQYADNSTNAVGGIIQKNFVSVLKPGTARYAATIGVSNKLVKAALDTNSNWWARNVAIFTRMDHGTTNYVRNPDCWAYEFDLTCMAAYNSSGWDMSTNGCCPWEKATRRAGTLISPRHVMFANHYTPPNGTELRFVANNNTVVSRVLSKSVQIGSTDLKIGVLDTDVPTNLIRFAKVLPSNFTNYFPNALNQISGTAIPALCLDQDENALESDISSVSTFISFSMPSDTTRSRFFENKISGDSGQPAFMILDGQLVLLTVWTSGGGGAGYFVTEYLNEINLAMATLGGSYGLTTVDLGAYPSNLR
jgi:hypothetical protein